MAACVSDTHKFAPGYDRAVRNDQNNRPLVIQTKRAFMRSFILILSLLVSLAVYKLALSSRYKRLWLGSYELPADDDDIVKLRTYKILNGHNDLSYYLRWLVRDRINSSNFTTPFENGQLDGHTDLVKLRQGRVGGIFWGIFTDCPTNDYDAEYLAKMSTNTQAAVDVLKRIEGKYPHNFETASASHDVGSIFKSGRIATAFGLEGLHMINNSTAKLREFYHSGVRYATLAHNCHNAYADAAIVRLPGSDHNSPAPPKWSGLSPAGEKIVVEMNRLGIMVDLSHASAATAQQVLERSTAPSVRRLIPKQTSGWDGRLAPPIMSHSNAFALCPHPRNAPDDVLQLIRARKGIVMVTFVPEFVSCYWPDGTPVPDKVPQLYPPNATMQHVVRHVRYIGDLIGYDHVGIGSDFGGMPAAVEGLDDVSRFPDLVTEMIKQGISDDDISKIIGRNILRVWESAEFVSEKMQAAGVEPIEDDLPVQDWPWNN
ncbi:hypothetical protein PFICI_08742 [Pestalotiopsis fici W106-1]|uniref:Dipeptidase n=1 Tax=Pestalotiopsis fici (strain W106-1 / CGMCC3.15140) TaxID=1229662 RepID=W3WYN4_PESFW|nr:uncharacterized protein PFICI_08742 [Pestalotiopsis fici W106-1]ETS78889.1 hypothetical protein PFICI_08742 [Pestalotiopsis fici W106-1]